MVKLIGVTVGRTIGALWRHRLAPFVPFFVVLLAGALLMWAANAIAPLAPFVYSLF